MCTFAFELSNSTILPKPLSELWTAFKTQLQNTNFHRLQDDDKVCVKAEQAEAGSHPGWENNAELSFHPPLEILFSVERPNQDPVGVVVKLAAGSGENDLCLGDIESFQCQCFSSPFGVAEDLAESLATAVNSYFKE
jgi:hypothetical protein